MIVVQELNSDSEFVRVGRVVDGEIVEGEDYLTAIDDEEVWTTYAPERLEMRFNGPLVVATEVEDPERT